MRCQAQCLKSSTVWAARLGVSPLRSFAAPASKIIDEVLAYARGCKDKPDEARSVLNQILGTHFDPPVGPGAGRLLLALADVEARDNSNWEGVQSLAAQACKAAKQSDGISDEESVLASEVQMEAFWVQTRAHLTLGNDSEAAVIAEKGVEAVRGMFFQPGAEQRRRQALTLANSAVAALQHAVGDFPGADATTNAVQTLTLHGSKSDEVDEERDRFIPDALKQIADLRAAQGQLAEASKLYKQAATAAKTNLESSKGGSSVLESPVHLGDLAADSLLGSAQLAANALRHEEAEDALIEALACAEAVGSDQHPRVALVLLVLGRLYASTARVSYAEGLYRESAKRLGVDKDGPKGDKPVDMPVHSSVAALLCWRFAQLLTVLPKRATEAGTWEERARSHFKFAGGLNVAPIEAVLGDLGALKEGGGHAGLGVVLNLTLRRALPVSS